MNRLSSELSDLETEYTQGWLAEMRKKREHYYEVIKNTTTEKELLTLTWYLLKNMIHFYIIIPIVMKRSIKILLQQ